MSRSPGSSASSAHDRYRQAITELALHGGRVAEIVDSAYDEMVDAMVAELFKVEAKAEYTNQRIPSLEEAVAKLKSRRR